MCNIVTVAPPHGSPLTIFGLHHLESLDKDFFCRGASPPAGALFPRRVLMSDQQRAPVSLHRAVPPWVFLLLLLRVGHLGHQLCPDHTLFDQVLPSSRLFPRRLLALGSLLRICTTTLLSISRTQTGTSQCSHIVRFQTHTTVACYGCAQPTSCTSKRVKTVSSSCISSAPIQWATALAQQDFRPRLVHCFRALVLLQHRDLTRRSL